MGYLHSFATLLTQHDKYQNKNRHNPNELQDSLAGYVLNMFFNLNCKILHSWQIFIGLPAAPSSQICTGPTFTLTGGKYRGF